MPLPAWLTIAVATLVCVFGAYRIRLAFRSDEENQRVRARRGLHAMGRRTHFLIGVVYLLLGSGLIATALGWNPLGGMFGPSTETPAKGAAATKTPVPVDQLPQSKGK